MQTKTDWKERAGEREREPERERDTEGQRERVRNGSAVKIAARHIVERLTHTHTHIGALFKGQLIEWIH